jgi:hypothetical protein
MVTVMNSVMKSSRAAKNGEWEDVLPFLTDGANVVF